MLLEMLLLLELLPALVPRAVVKLRSERGRGR
jgi:hypothetical protein